MRGWRPDPVRRPPTSRMVTTSSKCASLMDTQDPPFSKSDHVEWSDAKDGNNGCVRDALRSATNQARDNFFDGLGRIRSHVNRHQRVRVHWWYFPFIYVEVADGRWKHYPCYMRMLVSFDVKNGKFASLESASQYAFARRGWGTLVDELVGRIVRRYPDCWDPNSTDSC